MFKRFVILWACLSAFYTISAQYEGKEFWATCGSYSCYYITSQVEIDSAYLYILGRTHGTGYIQNPYTSYYATFEFFPDSLARIAIPPDEVFSVNDSTPIATSVLYGGSIVIRTSEKVQAWFETPHFSNYHNYSKIAKNCLLPIDYYKYDYNISLITTTLYSILAVEDSTWIFIDGDSVLLNQGEVLWPIWPDSREIHVTTNCKKIIVFPGTDCSFFTNGAPVDITCTKGRFFMTKVLHDPKFWIYMIIPDDAEASYPYQNHFSNLIAYHSNHNPSPYTLPFDSVIYLYRQYSSPKSCVERVEFFNPDHPYGSAGFMQHPSEVMVSHWDYPISKHTFDQSVPWLDTTYVDLTIYVHPDGLNSTTFNGFATYKYCGIPDNCSPSKRTTDSLNYSQESNE